MEWNPKFHLCHVGFYNCFKFTSLIVNTTTIHSSTTIAADQSRWRRLVNPRSDQSYYSNIHIYIWYIVIIYTPLQHWSCRVRIHIIEPRAWTSREKYASPVHFDHVLHGYEMWRNTSEQERRGIVRIIRRVIIITAVIILINCQRKVSERILQYYHTNRHRCWFIPTRHVVRRRAAECRTV